MIKEPRQQKSMIFEPSVILLTYNKSMTFEPCLLRAKQQL